MFVVMYQVRIYGSAIFFSAISDLIGRKLTIVIGGVVFTIGGAVQSASFFIWWVHGNLTSCIGSATYTIRTCFLPSLWTTFRMLFLGRIVAGVGVG